MADDFLSFSGLESAVSELIADLNRASGEVDAESEAAALAAAEIIAKEQRRLFAKAQFKRDKSSHTYKMANGGLISINRVFSAKRKVYKLAIGYDTPTLAAYPELLVIEFGRPGKSARRMKPTDKLGRKKGDFPAQVPHIRAGLFLAKDKAVKEFNERLFEIARSRFNGN